MKIKLTKDSNQGEGLTSGSIHEIVDCYELSQEEMGIVYVYDDEGYETPIFPDEYEIIEP